MHRPTERNFALHLVLGGLIAFAGSAAGLWLPAGMALFLAGIAVCRICWLEDNIHEDLLQADRIPAGYQTRRNRRPSVFGRDAHPATEDPVGLAELLRIQSLAWSAFVWAVVCGALLASGLSGAAVLAALTLGLALRSADYFAVAQALVLDGRRIPRRLLLGDGPLRQIAVNGQPKK